MSEPITSFKDENSFLSNFFPVKVVYEGVEYPSVEHAYVASKTTSLKHRDIIRTLSTPGSAKRYGRELILRGDWEEVRVPIMINLLTQKFTQPFFMKKLLETGDRELIEGNTWKDTFWGVCDGVGHNILGKILMDIRRNVRELMNKGAINEQSKSSIEQS